MALLPLPLRLDRAGSAPAAHPAGRPDPGDRHVRARPRSATGCRAVARSPTDLGVSRALAEQAYDQLVAEGWLEGRHGSRHLRRGQRVTPRSARRRRAVPPRRPLPIRLGTGTPWIDPRHAAAWRRAWRDVSSATPPSGYDDPRGLPELRAELAAHLARTRGLHADPEELLVTGGHRRRPASSAGGAPTRTDRARGPRLRAAAQDHRTAGRAGARPARTGPAHRPDRSASRRT